MIFGDHGPPVGQEFDVTLAGVDHRLNREGHAGDQFDTGAGIAVVQHLWLLMKFPTDAVTAIFTHHRAVLGLGVLLDGMADVAKIDARPYQANADAQAFISDSADALSGDWRGAHLKHPAGVAVKAVLDNRDVDVKDVALLQLFRPRNTVTDDMID